MRKISYIILHCSDTEAGKDFHVQDIDRWHKQRGWAAVGYHYVIPLDGHCEEGRVLESVGAHCAHYNQESIGICYIGGRRKGKVEDTRTPEQLATMEKLVLELLERFPEAQVCGHHDLNPHKACPCFNVLQWCISIGVPPHQIYRYAI